MLRRLGQRLFLLAALCVTALFVGEGASANVIVYEIGSSGEIGQSPFSGIVAHCRNPEHDHSDDDDEDDDDRDRDWDRDDDDDERHGKGQRDGGKEWRSKASRSDSEGHRGKHRDARKHWGGKGDEDRDDEDHDGGKRDDDDDDGGFDKHDLKVLSSDLSGLIALSSEEPLLFLEGQELVVEEFSLAGSARLCPNCEELALSIDLDSRFDSILRVEEGSLEGEIRLLLSLDGGEEREFSIKATGETHDPEWNSATPDFLSLMLELDFSDALFREELDDDEHGYRDDDDDDDDDDDRHHKGCPGDCRVFLKAQGAVVPEPGSALLLGAGLMLLALTRRR